MRNYNLEPKFRLLDLFCGAGGGAEGYHRAGFEVIGVDHRPQPNYPFKFHQADALEFAESYGSGFDVIHASPPCQAYVGLRNITAARYGQDSLPQHPDLIEATRKVLQASGKSRQLLAALGGYVAKQIGENSLSVLRPQSPLFAPWLRAHALLHVAVRAARTTKTSLKAVVAWLRAQATLRGASPSPARKFASCASPASATLASTPALHCALRSRSRECPRSGGAGEYTSATVARNSTPAWAGLASTPAPPGAIDK